MSSTLLHLLRWQSPSGSTHSLVVVGGPLMICWSIIWMWWGRQCDDFQMCERPNVPWKDKKPWFSSFFRGLWSRLISKQFSLTKQHLIIELKACLLLHIHRPVDGPSRTGKQLTLQPSHFPTDSCCKIEKKRQQTLKTAPPEPSVWFNLSVCLFCITLGIVFCLSL